MEFIVEQLVRFWQFTTLGVLILIGWTIDFVSHRYSKNILTGKGIDFSCDEMPHMQPIKIETKGKGFFGAIWLWMMSSRNWTISKDFHYKINGEAFVIPAGFKFDGASVPKFLASFLSPVGVLLIGGLVHDYGYKYQTLLKKDKKSTIGIKDQRWMDRTFRDINIYQNGFHLLNYLAYWALRIGGFAAWNGHRKVNAKIEGVK
jgi:hypothetical protein|tara:strand:- start:6393 stop:7001 length:609 start_codon:yes stop_codon:yes gene_type:complete